MSAPQDRHRTDGRPLVICRVPEVIDPRRQGVPGWSRPGHTELFPSDQRALSSVAWRIQSWVPWYPQGRQVSSSCACHPSSLMSLSLGVGSLGASQQPSSYPHPAGGTLVGRTVAGDRGTLRGILWRVFKKLPCRGSIFVQLLVWDGPSLPVAPLTFQPSHPYLRNAVPSTWGTAPDLGNAPLSHSFIPRLETGPRREGVGVRGMPQSSPRLLSCCNQAGGQWNLGRVPPWSPRTAQLLVQQTLTGCSPIPRKMEKEKGM